jgi:hypothetical protein
MTERMIFPELKLFKRTVMDHFLVALREIYKIHPAYPYNDTDSSQTQIHIEPTYGNITFEGKNPQMLVKVGQYEFALQDMLGGNISGMAFNSAGVAAGFKAMKNMSTLVSVVVKSYAEEESSDIADELSMLGTYAAHHMFVQVGVNIRGSAVSETQQIDPSNNLFQTIVNFSVDIPWELSKFTETASTDPVGEVTIPPINNGEYVAPDVYSTIFKDQSK